MIDVGRYARLKVLRMEDIGARLDAGTMGELLLPTRYVPEGCQPGDKLMVFVSLDSEDRPIATMEKPKAQVNECAWLKVVSVSSVGAFLDWGLSKDLFVPFSEQGVKMQEGRFYLVYIYEDNTGRLAATTKLNRFIKDRAEGLASNQEVSLLIADKTDLGVKAVINHEFWGLLYHDQLFTPVRKGQSVSGYIKRIRPDGKIELSLYQPGYGKVSDFAETIIDALKANEGFLPLNDKSAPDAIYATFNVSKGVFKQAIGALYKKHLIVIEKSGIRLIE
ncbi:CvfB family protein [Marinobacter caseinilyticus]|uniref:CvfB family protein n=1 Tax=Marinobacter caseinilyticus TaxID=2692195 RepID=UPI00140C999D|nr:S1-like domain-containing RNA-binding protein [Marinobacter caseinilyticus]